MTNKIYLVFLSADLNPYPGQLKKNHCTLLYFLICVQKHAAQLHAGTEPTPPGEAAAIKMLYSCRCCDRAVKFQVEIKFLLQIVCLI
jgi:hypothetical protein